MCKNRTDHHELALGLALLKREKSGDDVRFVNDAIALVGFPGVLNDPQLSSEIRSKVPPARRILTELDLNIDNFPRPPMPHGPCTAQRVETLLQVLGTLADGPSKWISYIHEKDFDSREGDRFGFLAGDWLLFRIDVNGESWALWASEASGAHTYFLKNRPQDSVFRRMTWAQVEADPSFESIPDRVGDFNSRIRTLLFEFGYVSICAYGGTFVPPINHETLRRWIVMSGKTPLIFSVNVTGGRPTDFYRKRDVDESIPPLLDGGGVVDLGQGFGPAVAIAPYASRMSLSREALTRIIKKAGIQTIKGKYAQKFNEQGHRSSYYALYPKDEVDAAIAVRQHIPCDECEGTCPRG